MRIVSRLLLLALTAAVLAAAVVVALIRRELPSLPDHLALATYVPSQASRILAADGTPVGRISEFNRTYLRLSEIPGTVVQAFVSAEDRSYWKHRGIDFSAVLRAALANLFSSRRAEGGSTITQQVAKNLLVGDERTLLRKLREAVVALRMDRDLGKERVLEIYLNEVYLGSGAYGVAAAAREYFEKSAGDLTASEAALLAGLTKAPGAADPRTSPSRALARRNYVLGRMAEDGIIAGEEARRLATVSSAVTPRTLRRDDDPTAWFVEEVRRELLGRIGRKSLYEGGLTIRTTMDPSLQHAAGEALRRGIVAADRKGGWRGPVSRIKSAEAWRAYLPPDGISPWEAGVVLRAGAGEARIALKNGGEAVLTESGFRWTKVARADALLAPGDVVLLDLSRGQPELMQQPETEGALVALDPRSGAVLAMSGGFSQERSKFNRAVQARRQLGSSVKPFVYIAAIEQGYGSESPVLDAPIAIGGGSVPMWRPSQGVDRGTGLVTIRTALEQSRNRTTVRLLQDLGMETVEASLRRFRLVAEGPLQASAVLGSLEATPLQLAVAYAALANGGRMVKPRLTMAEPDESVSVAAASDTEVMTDILQGVVRRGTAAGAFRGFHWPVAGKTGTTNDLRDAWFVGYGPRLVVAVWIGRDDNKPLAGGASGGSTAAPVARDFLEAAGEAGLLVPFPRRDADAKSDGKQSN